MICVLMDRGRGLLSKEWTDGERGWKCVEILSECPLLVIVVTFMWEPVVNLFSMPFLNYPFFQVTPLKVLCL